MDHHVCMIFFNYSRAIDPSLARIFGKSLSWNKRVSWIEVKLCDSFLWKMYSKLFGSDARCACHSLWRRMLTHLVRLPLCVYAPLRSRYEPNPSLFAFHFTSFSRTSPARRCAPLLETEFQNRQGLFS